VSDVTEKRPVRRVLRAIAALTGVLVLSAGAVEMASSTTSCAAAATNNPLRSFDNARNVDVVCMQTLQKEDGGGLAPVPLPQAACTPVPIGVIGAILPNHLFALVTQGKRGEVAVVDLTAGVIVDEDLGMPGTNLLPVGQNPMGIASSADGKMSYVAAAEVNKPAIYALPSTLILGNSQQLPGGSAMTPPVLTTWPVCALPQSPTSITIVPNTPVEVVGDGGTDAGSPSGAKPNTSGYVLAVVIEADTKGQAARVLTIDPEPLIRGSEPSAKGGDADLDVDKPGQLRPCKILGEVPLSGTVSEAGAPSAPWPDGVKWVDGGLDAPVPSSVACTPGASADAGALPPAIPPPPPQPNVAARAGQYLYVADGALPLIHVFDLTNPDHPNEIEPLHATSLATPSRPVTISTIAISPPTRDYQRFLYAVDGNDSPASIIVYDITDPVASPHVPMKRPHSNLVPLQPLDRINFSSGVSALAFVQHDWPLAETPSGALTAGAASTGLLCNPNPNVDRFGLDASADAQTFTDPGAVYRNSSLAFVDEPLGPARLRGIFAFATLSNGEVVTIDVDDWDAPCRRPSIMGPSDAGNGQVTNGYTSAIAPPQPNIGNRDGGALDPYEAPYTGVTNGVPWVSNEVFFPVSAPHRPRSDFPLSLDPTLGIHYPYLVSAPQLYAAGPDGGLGAAVSGSVLAGNPVLLPTATTLPDPSDLPDATVGIRLAWEDPTAHIDQNWTVDYEGKLVSFSSLEGNLALRGEGVSANAPPYWSLFVNLQGDEVCSKGVEDWTVGQERAAAFVAANAKAGLANQPGIASWVGDYVQVADEIDQPNDPYWSEDTSANQPNDCWVGFNGDGNPPLTDPNDRYNTCYAIFGLAGDEALSRDYPIIQAFDDGLVITRFAYPPSTSTLPVAPSNSNRTIVHQDSSNIQIMKQLQCCFHGQSTFNVRTGGEWVTTGSTSGYLHHITVDPKTNRCVNSCDPEKALLNSRLIGVASSDGPDSGATFVPDRDSPLAMRNPSFAFYIQHAYGPDPSVSPESQAEAGAPTVVLRPARDFVWQFGLKGELVPLSVNLAATNTSINPQSMLFIPSLGQLAIVDGSESGQGLILIDLNSVAVTGNSFF
jgi:hypothetical protein